MPLETGIPLYTSSEAAAYLGLGIDSIRKYVQRGLIVPCDLRVGVANLFTREELDRFQREKRTPGRPRKTG